MIKSIGLWRVAIAGTFFSAGVFFFVSMMSAGNFGWGFAFLDAAIVYALIWPAFVVIDALIFLAQRMNSAGRSQRAEQDGHGFEVIYFLINWFSAGFYLLAMMS